MIDYPKVKTALKTFSVQEFPALIQLVLGTIHCLWGVSLPTHKDYFSSCQPAPYWRNQLSQE